MTMEPFDAYRYYQALKLHFESDSYDAIKYNYKTSAKPQSFWKRKDKYFFAKIANRFKNEKQLIQYFLSFFLEDKKWVGDMLEDDSPYTQRMKRMESLTYIFENDMSYLASKYSTFDELFEMETHPHVIREYLSESISIETVVILNEFTNFLSQTLVTETLVWPDLSRKLKKYSQFVQVDREKFKNIVLKVFTE